MKKIIFLAALLFVFLPVLAQGQSLVPCGGPECPCTLCHFFLMLQRIINYLLTTIVPIVAVLVIVIGGVMMMSAFVGQSGAELISRSKKTFGAVAIGLIVVYGAWILINLFLNTLGVNGADSWFEIKCEYECDPWSGKPVNNNGDIVIPEIVPGCTDSAALNFNPKANINNGSCIYEEGQGEEEEEEEEEEEFCGNGIIDEEIGEVCDINGPELNGASCEDYGYSGGGILSCLNCNNFDVSGCIATYCGDGIIQTINDSGLAEYCDGGTNGKACTDFGYSGGILTCVNCNFDVSGCVNNYCGDNIVQKPNDSGVMEVCDGSDLGGKTCADFHLAPGNLKCNNDCLEFDPTLCGAILPPESGNGLYNCQFFGADLAKQAAFDGTSVYLKGIWSINKVNSVDEMGNYYTTCINYGNNDTAGPKNLIDFAGSHPDGQYIAYAGFDESFLFFEIKGGKIIVSGIATGCTDPTAINYNPKAEKDDGSCIYVGCLSCPGNELGLCDITDCPVTHGCNYAQVTLLGGLTGGICVNPTDCYLCGTIPGDTCTSIECSSIGASCEFILGAKPPCVLP